MSIGATSRSGSIGYTPGSMHKRFQQSNMRQLNRAAVESYNSAFNFGGTQMFSVVASESMGRSEQAAQDVAARIQAQADALKASVSLGGLLNTSA